MASIQYVESKVLSQLRFIIADEYETYLSFLMQAVANTFDGDAIKRAESIVGIGGCEREIHGNVLSRD